MRDRKRHAPMTGGRSGFTLIELMVVMVISSIIMVGMVGLFRSNRTAFSLLDQMRNLEENGRVAADFMARELRPLKQEGLHALDNGDPNYGATQTALGAKNGTDIIRVFSAINAIDPIYIADNPLPPSDYNPTAATMTINKQYLSGFPGYPPAGSLSALLSGYTSLIYNCYADPPHLPVTYANGGGDCTQDITSAVESAGNNNAKMGYNRANDNANRPHQCDGGPGAGVGPGLNATSNAPESKDMGVCVSIGEQAYYYVRDDDPGNNSGVPVPQLVRYNTALGVTEAVANNVEDMQVLYGLDTTGDGAIDSWVDGRMVGDPRQVLAIRVQYLMVSTEIDPEKGAEAPPFLSNSSIVNNGVADQKRRRVITRTTRLRNAS